jgi:hypothetical protein
VTDIDIMRGDTTEFDVIVTRFNATTEQDEPVSLSGAKMWFTVKHNKRDADVDAVFKIDSVTDPIKIRALGNPADGIIRISLLDTDTDSFPGGTTLVFDVQLKEAVGTVTTVEHGYVDVDRDVTISVA